MENRTLINYSCDEANAIAEDLRNEYPDEYADFSDYDLFLESWEIMRGYFEDDLTNLTAIKLPGQYAVVTDGEGHDIISCTDLGNLFGDVADMFKDDYFSFSVQNYVLTYVGANHDTTRRIEIYPLDNDFSIDVYNYLDFFSRYNNQMSRYIWQYNPEFRAKQYFENREKYRNKHIANVIPEIANCFGF